MPHTKVTICLHKPNGYEDTYVVETDDRGSAMRIVMDFYPIELRTVNSITASLIDEEEGRRMIDQKRAWAASLQKPFSLVGSGE